MNLRYAVRLWAAYFFLSILLSGRVCAGDVCVIMLKKLSLEVEFFIIKVCISLLICYICERKL